MEKEEDEEAEKEEEEDEGALQVDCLHCPRVLHPCGPDRKYLKGFAWEETATSDNSSKFNINFEGTDLLIQVHTRISKIEANRETLKKNNSNEDLLRKSGGKISTMAI